MSIHNSHIHQLCPQKNRPFEDIKTRYNHKAASHQFDGKMDLNKELVKMIMESKIETIENNK